MTEEERNRTASAVNRWVARERLETVRLMAERNAKEASSVWERDFWKKIETECTAAIKRLVAEAKQIPQGIAGISGKTH